MIYHKKSPTESVWNGKNNSLKDTVQEEHPLAPNYFIQVHVENNNREKVQPL